MGVWLPPHTHRDKDRLWKSSSALQTERLGAELCRRLGPKRGDVVLLNGQVGCGKSVFARGFIRQAVGNALLRVQSPTFLLQQEYRCAGDGLAVHHFDLYRFQPEMTLVDARAMDWLGCLQGGVSLVEWPERIVGHRTVLLPALADLRYVHVTLAYVDDNDDDDDDDEHRRITVDGIRLE